MLIKRKQGWELPESCVTPEEFFLDRRRVLAGLGALAAAGTPGLAAADEDPTADLYPAIRSPGYAVERPTTPESLSGVYNNFYEFGSHKQIARAAQALPTRPWELKVDGLCAKPTTFGIDDLIRKIGLEERIYRLRCVEGWSIVVPWTGFPLSRLVELAEPSADAKFLRMETFLDAKVAIGQKQFWYPWPYVEGLTLAEATNELAFLVTGAYGKPLPKQFGAPLRLAVPWKYGFKSIKSIVRFAFTAEQPKTFWEKIQPEEYGFWANVNPEVPHKRWSQATEQVIGTDERIPTMKYNGYEQFVAHLYTSENETFYM